MVLPLVKGKSYAVLDGATRTGAFRRLGLPYILVQVVSPGREFVQLKTWNHVITGCSLQSLLEELRHISGLCFLTDHAAVGSLPRSPVEHLALLVAPGDTALKIVVEARDLEEHAMALDKLVRACCRIGFLERSEQFSLDRLLIEYPGLTAVLNYAPLQVGQILEMVRREMQLPPGLTRFIISPRALRLNYPIARLAAGGLLEEKQLEVESWLQVRVGERDVRYYAESTWLFDE